MAVKNFLRTKVVKFVSLLKAKKQWSMKDTCQVSIILVAFVVGLIIPSKLAITKTPSLKHRVYYISKISAKDTIKRNNYVLFKMKENRYVENEGNLDVMKIAVCVTGDTLTESNRDYYCNGVYLGHAKEQSLKGQKVDNFKFNGLIPPDNIFVMGQHKDSFDSRYYGFVERKDVKAITYPIF